MGFYSVGLGLSWVFIAFSRVFIDSLWFLLDFDLMGLSFDGFSFILKGWTGFPWVFTDFLWILLGLPLVFYLIFTAFLLGFTGF